MEHMQAVKTVWTIAYERNFFTYRIQVEFASELPETLEKLRKSGVTSATITERRTCGALPGLCYTSTDEVTL